MSDSWEFKRLKAIWDGDGSDLREQFIYAGLLLTIFERFKNYVVDHVDGFLSNQMQIADGDLRCIRSDEFKRLIKERGMGKPGQHRNKDFRAALHWFYDLHAISKEELDEVERIYLLRNEIGHELFRILADDSKAPLELKDVLVTFGIYVNIVRWWVKEVEVPINPDFAKDYYSIEVDDIESTDTIFLREIIHKTLSGNPSWEELQGHINSDSAGTK